MSNVNITVTPNPGVQAAQPAPPVRHAALNTRRSLLKYVLLGLVTFGIYDLWQMTEITSTVNLVCTRRDGKRTMNYLLMFLLVGCRSR